VTLYIGRRLLQAVVVLWAAYTVSFIVLYALPADPVSLLAGSDATDISAAQLDELRQRLGLDRPLIVQYFNQLVDVLHGDLGTSIVTGRSVTTILAEAIPPTLQIAAAGFVLAVVFGGGIAFFATFTRNRKLSDFLIGLPPLGVAVPSFWLGLLLIQWFSFAIPLFPAVGDGGPISIVLPAITLAVPTGAVIAQLLAKSLDTTLREPYIDTAWAKGVRRTRLHLRHGLRNAALPALTMTGLIIGQLLGGTVVTETVFSRPGVGRVTAAAVQQQDIPVVQGVVLFAASVFVIANLTVDLIYPHLDPRIVLAGGRKRRRGATSTTSEDAAAVPSGTESEALEPVGGAR
jgi:peptide/nickel transport system permease protein